MAGDRVIRWLVTAGPTCEDIDPVRFVTNRSSGRMGYAVARAAVDLGRERGDEVTLVSGPVVLEPPAGCDLVRVRSAREMLEAVTLRFESVDIVIMAAAVADFRPESRSDAKIKKTGGGLVLKLEPTEDVLAELGRRKRDRKRDRILIGFALEAPGSDAAASSGQRSRPDRAGTAVFTPPRTWTRSASTCRAPWARTGARSPCFARAPAGTTGASARRTSTRAGSSGSPRSSRSLPGSLGAFVKVRLDARRRMPGPSPDEAARAAGRPAKAGGVASSGRNM